MSDIETADRAFPWCGDLNETPTINLGMTLRDYFAAKAMPRFISHDRNRRAVSEPDEVAKQAYEQADAMIRARGAA